MTFCVNFKKCSSCTRKMANSWNWFLNQMTSYFFLNLIWREQNVRQYYTVNVCVSLWKSRARGRERRETPHTGRERERPSPLCRRATKSHFKLTNIKLHSSSLKSSAALLTYSRSTVINKAANGNFQRLFHQYNKSLLSFLFLQIKNVKMWLSR